MNDGILDHFDLGDGGRPWQLPDGSPSQFEAAEYHLGKGRNALEVAVAISGTKPTVGDLRKLWGNRHGGRPSPVLCVVLYRERAQQWRAAFCGPTGEDPPAVLGLDIGQTRRLCLVALDEPDRHAAARFLLESLPATSEDPMVGVRNVGMFATHELSIGVPARSDWDAACDQGRAAIEKSGRELVEALGFELEERGPTTTVLRAEGTARAVAVFLDETESPEGAAPRFAGTSPATHGLAAADRDGLPYVLLTRGRQIRVYATGKDVGVGRKGRAETFIEANLALLPDDAAGYLPLVFGAGALRDGGSFEDILDRSRDYATALGSRLRDRVYKDVVPSLAKAVVGGRRGDATTDLEGLYQQTLVILFRMLFLAYAEDKDLLPYRASSTYQRHALKTLARDFADRRNAGALTFDSASTDLWTQAKQLFAAVYQGNTEWQVPEYDGGLFSPDPEVSETGAAIEALELTNEAFGEPLAALLVDGDEHDLYGPVDFRSLSVREFGTIYEGLLESSLSLASQDLTLDRNGAYLPAGDGDQVIISEGEIYLHNRSGSRKATGSYFTKPFAVEHLLETALEPALDDHLTKVGKLLDADDEPAAADAFFDFRCADIAMGSGHFLVAAVDHIEARLSSFLAERPIPEVTAELERLRARAVQTLGDLAAGVEIEQSSLLRRQVARRCVYGVDRNAIAVELARLAMWIHTFVPGLPLSFLDHNLVCGDSLTGIGTVEEAAEILSGGNGTGPTLFETQMFELLGRASDALGRLARASDADAREVARAREAAAEAQEAVEPVAALYDLLVAVRLGRATRFEEMTEDVVARHPQLDAARALSRELTSLHFPVAFPEVFLRDSPGFECLVGNPPWDKVRFEPDQFWVTRAPGLKSRSEPEQKRWMEDLRRARPADAQLEAEEQEDRELLQELFTTAYSFQGSGHLDYAKLFVERATRLALKGRLGYVLPRQALVLGGWAELRALLLGDGRVAVMQARNAGGWLFDDVEHRYMVVFLTRSPASRELSGSAIIWPVALNEDALRMPPPPLELSPKDIDQISESKVLPWLNHAGAGDLFWRLAAHSRLSDEAGWVSASVDTRWDFSGSGRHAGYRSDRDSEGAWRVLMARHVLAFRIDVDRAFRRFIPEPQDLVALDRGVVIRAGTVALDETHPALTFRFPSRNDDARTVIAAPLADSGFLYSAGYEHGVRHSGSAGTAELLALLGYLNSFVCDWWARRIVDRHVTAPMLNKVPIPDWGEADVELVADLTAALVLRANAFDQLAGGRDLTCSEGAAGMSDDALRAQIEAATMHGFSLSSDDLEVILDDFSNNGCPTSLRVELERATSKS